MRRTERLVFDFETNAWVLPDAFNTRAQGHEIVLDTPADAPAPGRWTKPVPKEGPIPPAFLLAVCSAVAFLAAAVVFKTFALVIPAFFLGSYAAIIKTALALASFKLTWADRMLLEDPEDRDVCLVHMTVSRNGQTVGTDKGVVWFSDGMILYNGHRTSFALGGEDMLPKQRWGIFPSAEGTSELGDRSLPLRIEDGRADVHFHPIGGGGRVGGAQEMRFLKRLYAFRHRPPQSRGSRQWPPLEP